jgi:hypothetical protein
VRGRQQWRAWDLRGVGGNGLAGVRAQGGLATGNSSTRNGGVGGDFAAPLSFSGNVFAGNSGGSVVGGTALLGNSCDDGKCARVESRRYYQTQGIFDGAHALTACAAGFHMASLDELHFARGLKYDQSLGLYFPNLYDQGRGLLAHGAFTWVRTGIASNNGTVAGEANCSLWTSTSGFGTNIRWQANLTSPATQASPFVADVQPCVASEYVMCIED